MCNHTTVQIREDLWLYWWTLHKGLLPASMFNRFYRHRQRSPWKPNSYWSGWAFSVHPSNSSIQFQLRKITFFTKYFFPTLFLVISYRMQQSAWCTTLRRMLSGLQISVINDYFYHREYRRLSYIYLKLNISLYKPPGCIIGAIELKMRWRI